ncbi:MAG: hypothetical protein GX559_02070 [Candidatus Pacebacteria bacterium]|nr:hypothetical protein [Candidatus Paceibacterota bacterium]
MTDETTGGSPSGGKEQGNNVEIITTPEGFKIHGENETSLILSLTSLNGKPISQLENIMRPGASSGAGFLGNHESLIEVLVDDNETVLGLGLTHQQLANFLRKIASAPVEKKLGQYEQYEVVDVDGKKFARAVERVRGIQQSPFNDGTLTNADYKVINLETGASISYSGLSPEMVHRYGFYEGKGTSYRLDPKLVAETAELTPPQPDDPVAKLVQDPHAQVEITTSEQLTRVSNLYSAEVDVLSGENYRLVPQDLNALLQLSTFFERSPHDRGLEQSQEPQELRERREHIATRVDTQGITPQPYLMGSYSCNAADKFIFDSDVLTEIVPLDCPDFIQQAVLRGIEHLQLPRGGEGLVDMLANESVVELVIEYLGTKFLRNTLKGISEKINGQDSPHKAYYEGLLKKLSPDPQTALQLYDIAIKLKDQPELITALDNSFPTLKTYVVAFYKHLGVRVEDMTLEELMKKHGSIDQ